MYNAYGNLTRNEGTVEMISLCGNLISKLEATLMGYAEYSEKVLRQSRLNRSELLDTGKTLVEEV